MGFGLEELGRIGADEEGRGELLRRRASLRSCNRCCSRDHT